MYCVYWTKIPLVKSVQSAVYNRLSMAKFSNVIREKCRKNTSQQAPDVPIEAAAPADHSFGIHCESNLYSL
jgi:hypothetical protein